ncbi:MAG: ribonuclease R, partial [Alistipes sp.]|nr:ribonuclease R [Alistipes sp.]
MKKTKQPRKIRNRNDRASIILNLLREMPNNKFSLKHLASASGGATKEGRRETLEIIGRLFDEGIVEECARQKYRLTRKHLPRYEGTASMNSTGVVFVRVEGIEQEIYVHPCNSANALNGDRVEAVILNCKRKNKQPEGEIVR